MTTEELIAKLAENNLDLINERERLLYWLCRAYEPHTIAGVTPFGRELESVLASFGYDNGRVKRMLELGEPTAWRSKKVDTRRTSR